MKWTNIKKDLRKPQIKSLELTEKYLTSIESGACLIHMPTGSGKSGIIATICNLQFDKCTIIVTPRIALTDQIKSAVEKDFFEDVLKKKANPNNKIFKDLLSDQIPLDDKGNYDDIIYISTIQKLDWIRKNNIHLYESLIKEIKLVIFDEGHYEPAYSWSQTIRGFKSKKILFTATPFRNDLKPFDILDKFIFPYKYADGIKDKYLREVEFKSENREKDDDSFLKKVLAHYKFKFGSFTKDSPKIIIRCSQRSTIIRLTNKIKKDYKSIEVVSIHETFKSSKEPYLVSSVPKKPAKHSAKIWIHQNKLLEGIDDNQFKMLAIYDDFKNDRALIQQIGRLVRVAQTNEQFKAYVIDFSNGRHEKIWNNYLEFDKKLDKSSFKPMSDKILEKFYGIGEDYEYLLDGFKKKFDFNSNKLPESIKIPLRTNFIQKHKNFDLENFKEFISEKLEEDDKRYIYEELTFNKIKLQVYFCLNISLSPYLDDYYSINIGNELIVFFEFNDVLSYFDSTGFLPIGEEDLGLGKVKEADFFKRLFNEEKDSWISSVSLKNSNLGTNSIRAHTISANSIDNTVSYLDDKSQIVSTATGKHRKLIKKKKETEKGIEDTNITQNISRYVGLSKGRVSQRAEWVELDDYVDWVNNIHTIMNDSSLNPKSTFARYAKAVNTVKETNPKHILLDIGEISNDFKLTEELTINDIKYKKNEHLVIEDVCSEVSQGSSANEFEFNIKISDDISVTLQLSYDSKKKTYHVDGDDLDKYYQPNNNVQFITITQFLNTRQSFKIIPEEPNVIYAYGEFYEVHSNFGKGFKEETFNLRDIIIPIKELNTINSEKGKTTTRNAGGSWVQDSIFGLLDDLGVKSELEIHIKTPDIVVFDDMNTEMADVIYGYESKTESKVIFIHAKCGSGSLYSATALQEVTSQATKNIKYLNSYNELPKERIRKWNSKWKSRGLVVDKRIRKPNIKGKETLERLEKIIQNPNSTKEVWLVLGKTLEYKELIKALEKGKAEAIQATLLLHSTLQSVGTVNAKLKVFCSP
ncbi:DEAD/DEAH box helicase [Aestuariibaculum lutulentum]|uniref:DEAD/DEAH box helicase family protein n=1 Tax=Aestuariibaculum lutulentum TaxID=2920935 RepID=A0ABS9REP1_9FLAO|nr:DEAD/DEAH box helicase family protein [Aestuariibaculum lutulentum]MCH4551417.1 DEAD/DEAH box helicase family protein [Aestuariibaculum lutulentum]